MINRRFMLKVLNGEYKKLNLLLGMQVDLGSLLYYFDGCQEFTIKETLKGYYFEAYHDDYNFYVKFVELENY